MEALSIHAETQQMRAGAATMKAQGGLDGGAAPVRVRLPIEGQPQHFEKLLALNEDLSVSFSYKVN